MTMLAKDLSPSHSRSREVRDGSFQFITILLFCFSMALFVILMGLLISDRLTNYYMMPHEFSVHQPPFSSFSSFNFSPAERGLSDWITPKELWHSMSDEELMWRASMYPLITEYPYNRTPKVAFMFLAKTRLPLGPIWERFFKGHERFFSLYLHCSPEFTEEPPKSSVFYKRRIPSKPVEWGKASMIDAERRLLANALLDYSNERLVLLSETCIPIFNFTTIYNYLINSNHSFLGSFDDPRPIGRGRYNKKMWPTISISDWRKGSQWFEVHRELAIHIVSDKKYYPVFKEHCKPPCYMDEHYLATLVAKIKPESNSNRSITWVDWSTHGSHPKTFVKKDVSEVFLKKIREEEGFNCSYNGGKSSICFLFARKFHPSCLEPLLHIMPALLGFDP